tara:strand:+ start:30 stop:248 length:219 start_codon:yes stop_codon:yes gene_type:complete
MEYTNWIQPLFLIFISCGIGMVLGSLHMFLIMFNENKSLKKELDERDKIIKNHQRQIDAYESHYEDDNYDAY